MSCENNLFIQTKSIEQKEYFLNILGNNQYFFQSFILNFSADILIDDVTFDITSSDDIINCIFNIETPCIEFCKRICGLHGLNVQLVYYNKESNYSGKFQIYRNQVVTNETITYWQGMYKYNYDLFWELLDELFESRINLNDLHILEKDFSELNNKYQNFLLIQQFEKL